MEPSKQQAMRSAGRASSIGIELAAGTLMGLGGGWWLDKKFGTDPYLTLLGLIIGAMAGFKALLQVAKQLQEEEKRSR